MGVQVEPFALDVTAHQVDAAVGRIAIAIGHFIERRDCAIAVLVFAFAGGENLIAGRAFQLVDVRLVDKLRAGKFSNWLSEREW